MTSSLSNLFDNLAEGIHEIKCKYGRDNKKCKTCEIKDKDCECCLEYINVKDYLILCIQMSMFYKNLQKRFANTHKFSKHDFNKFIFFSQKKVFAHMNTCMIEKNSMKYHYLKIKIFTVN